MSLHHRQLASWIAGVALVGDVYRASASLPSDERYGLVSQMRRSAISVPSNIAEGAARGSRGDYIRFLRLARGSLAELETQVIITGQLELLDPATVEGLLDAIARVARPLSGQLRALTPSAP